MYSHHRILQLFGFHPASGLCQTHHFPSCGPDVEALLDLSSTEEIIHTIKFLLSGKNPSPDGFSGAFYKQLQIPWLSFVNTTFNTISNTYSFSQQSQEAHITLILTLPSAWVIGQYHWLMWIWKSAWKCWPLVKIPISRYWLTWTKWALFLNGKLDWPFLAQIGLPIAFIYKIMALYLTLRVGKLGLLTFSLTQWPSPLTCVKVACISPKTWLPYCIWMPQFRAF